MMARLRSGKPHSIALIAVTLAVICVAGRAQPMPDDVPEKWRRDADAPLRWIQFHAAPQPKSSPPAKTNAVPQRKSARPAASGDTHALSSSPGWVSVKGARELASPASDDVAATGTAGRPVNDDGAKGEAVVDPVLLERVDPQWDPALMVELGSGRVDVGFRISRRGEVSDVAVTETSDPALNEAALAAVRQWRFASVMREISASVELGFDLGEQPRSSTAVAPVDDLVPLDQPEPQWPAELTQKLGKGRVTLRFEVGTDGKVSQSEIVDSSDARLDALALAALGNWRFAATASAHRVTIEFGFGDTQ